MRIFSFFLLFGLLAQNRAHAVLDVQVTNLVHETCTYANGAIWVSGTGGLPPYTYSWSDGPTDQQRGGLSAGSYTVTVTDANLDQAATTVDVFSNPYQIEAVTNSMPWCFAPGQAFNDPMVSGMTNTWTVNGTLAEINQGGLPIFYPDPWAGSFTYTVDDGNGCSGTITGTNGPQITSWPALTITSVEPSCTNQSIGAIHVLSDGLPVGGGPFGPYVNLIRDDGVPQYQAQSPDQFTYDLIFDNLEPGYYGIHWWLGVTAEDLDPGQCTYDTIWVTVPNLGPTCGSVQGTSYFDLDGNCVKDANEVGIPYSPLLVQPGNEAVLTDNFGQFAFALPNGNYTLEQTDPTLVPICPLPQPVPFTVNTDLTTIHLANGSTEPLDLLASLAGTIFRPGFNAQYHVVALNDSPQQSGPVTLTLALDPILTYVTSDVAPVANGNTLTWTFPAFTSFQWESLHVTVNVPVGTPLGTPLSSTLTVSNTLPDGNAANNVDTDNEVVVGSYDPNDKRAQTSSRASESLYFINGDEWIDYTIRFQNTGTFPAEFVVITDTIAPELDMVTFEQGVASHPFNVSFKPGRVIEWRFDGIQLPDSSSDEPSSHGLVKFRMRPRLPLLPGTSIENVANIFFDYNPPVITEPSVLMAEFSTAQAEGPGEVGRQLTLFPNPATDELQVMIRDAGVGAYTADVLSMDGRVLMHIGALSRNAKISTASLAAGAYVLRLRNAEGRTQQASFMKR
jgi:uncharacterized repeat protein (TIGR01451 family)